MENKAIRVSISLLTILLFSFQVKAQQIVTKAYSNYISVGSYQGSVTQKVFTLQIEIKEPNVNFQDWSLLVRTNGAITNSEGKIMDPSKVRIRINSTTGDGPNIQQMGASTAAIPLSQSGVYIINKSKAKLATGPNEYYKQFNILFDIIVDGGAYLEALKSWKLYDLGLVFSLVQVNGALISQCSSSVQMQIAPSDMPPSEPTYGIQVNSIARSGLLEFKTMADYANGVSQMYQNGLSVISSTPYAVQVRALSPNFTSSGNSMPISIVKLNIADPNNTSIGGTVSLSDIAQTVFTANNSNTQPRLFNIKYFTAPNDERLLQAKPANYSATLLYTLIPQ